jgi:hypothetical protein
MEHGTNGTQERNTRNKENKIVGNRHFMVAKVQCTCMCAYVCSRFDFILIFKSVFLAEFFTYGHSMILFFTFQFYELTSFHTQDIPEHPAKPILKKARRVCVRARSRFRSIPALLQRLFFFPFTCCLWYCLPCDRRKCIYLQKKLSHGYPLSFFMLAEAT